MRIKTNTTLTENGGIAYKSTLSGLLDFFATVGALRSRSDEEIINIFENAYAEDKLLAVKILFYGRDIRGGCGERRLFRVLIAHCARRHPEAIENNLDLIGVYGRYDDLYSLIGTPLEDKMWITMKNQWDRDIADYRNGNAVSLLAKWIKTPDSKSTATKTLGILTCKKISNSNVYEFKRQLRKLRKRINIVESYMCRNEWSDIKYSTVPSRAMMIYRNAFLRHDENGFNEYLTALQNGDAKINAETLYPYDIIKPYMDLCNVDNTDNLYHEGSDPIIESQWKALPDYLTDINGNHIDTNVIVMSDVSGSMFYDHYVPICSSVSLGIYFAQRNKGDFHNLMMTFSEEPSFISIKDGQTLHEITCSVLDTDWGLSTNFNAAMRAILDVCVQNNVPADEVPKALICITDMEFDKADCNRTRTLKQADEMFRKAGYKRPHLVFWNVNARRDTFHVTKDDMSAVLISGHSPSAFKTVINSIGMTAYDAMLLTLNSDRYNAITIGS